MSGAIKLIQFFIWAAVLPVLMGLFPLSFLEPDRRRIHTLIVAGYTTNFALFELIGIPVLLLTPTGDFYLLLRLFVAAGIAVVIIGIVRCAKTGGIQAPAIANALRGKKTEGGEQIPLGGEELVYWIVFALLFSFQIYMAYTRASFDGDDAYYVAESLQAWQTGTMYHYIPYTGITTTLDRRHAMAMLPMWIAMIAKLCNTHPTIVAHTMLPMVFLPLADMCVFSVGRALMHNMQEKLRRRIMPAFMVLLAMMQIFGNNSIYLPETFLLMRTWQGKTVFVYMILPLAYYCLLLMAHRAGEGEKLCFVYVLMISLNIASGFTTAMAPVLTALVFGTGSLILCIYRKRLDLLWKTILCCIPNVVYLVLLLGLMLPTLLAKFYYRG